MVVLEIVVCAVVAIALFKVALNRLPKLTQDADNYLELQDQIQKNKAKQAAWLKDGFAN